VLRTCEKHGFTVNWKKSEHLRYTISFCGFELNKTALRIDPDKYKLLQEYPRPKSANTGIKWRATLEFNRRYYKDVQQIIEPITNMFKHGVKSKLETEQEDAWQEWLRLVPSIRHQHDSLLPLHIDTDASNSAWAAVYYQVDTQGEEIIMELRGGLLNDAERKAMMSEREFLAMSNAADGCRYWTVSQKVNFHVDHSALLAYTSETLITPNSWRQQVTHLWELNIII
jgi:hypothetical protein